MKLPDFGTLSVGPYGRIGFEIQGLGRSKRTYRVRLAEADDSPAWDYDLTADVRGCASLEEALYSLGLG